MEGHQLVLRVSLLGTFELELPDGTKLAIDSLFGRSHSAILFKLLLCHSKRRITRDRLVESLWPGQSYSVMEGSLSVAKSVLKTRLEAVCGQPVMPRVSGEPPSYSLAGQTVIWTDVDACEQLIRQAVNTKGAQDALPLWEAAFALMQGGILLAEDTTAYWYQTSLVQDRGKLLARQRTQCVLRLADLSLEVGYLDRALAVLTSETETDPANEDILFHLMDLLAQQGRGSEALQFYTRLEAALLECNVEPRDETQALARLLRSVGPTKRFTDIHHPLLFPVEERGLAARLKNLVERVGTDANLFPARHQAVLSELPALPALVMSSPQQENTLDLMKSRRQMLHDLLMLASTVLVLSPYARWSPDRSEQSVTSVANAVLDDLERITASYWRLCANTSLDLLGSVLEHFQIVIHLLKRPQPREISERLYTLSGEIAQILGKTLFDLHEYALAWSYYTFSLKASQAAFNHDMWGVGLGRMSLLLIYWNQPQEALPLLQEARQLTIQSPRILCWLAAVEAEVYAQLGEADACDVALTTAKTLAASATLGEDHYATGFNPSRLAGYEGACMVRLRQPDRALPALQQALALIDPQSIRRRSTLFTDMGIAHAQQGNVQNACTFAVQALTITAQTKSISVLERVRQVRRELEPWKETEDVKKLEKQLDMTLALITKEEALP